MSLESRRCPKCLITKPAKAFGKNSSASHGMQTYCKHCNSTTRVETSVPRICSKCREAKVLAEFYANPSGLYKRSRYCRACAKSDAQTRYTALRRRVLGHYSADTYACNCCGEGEYAFLTIDHVNGNGAQHRRVIGTSSGQLYGWLEKHKHPAGFQVLCYNCNLGKRQSGQCPHEHRRTPDHADNLVVH